MVSSAKVRLYGCKSRHSINLPSDLVRDSAFPFKINDSLIIKIENDKLIIEKACMDETSIRKEGVRGKTDDKSD
jgi:hypothetical protein